MDERLYSGVPSGALSTFATAGAAYLDQVSAGLFSKLPAADLLAELRDRELLWRRQAVADHALLAEIGARGIPGRLSMPSTTALLSAMLLLSPYEAKQRVSAAEVCGPRVSRTGADLGRLGWQASNHV